jgi:hypothetical protein
MADAADSELRQLHAAYRTAANKLETAKKNEASTSPIIRIDQYGHKEVMKSDALREAEFDFQVVRDKFQKFATTPEGADAVARRNRTNAREEELKGLFGARRRTAKKSGRKTGKKARKTKMLKSRRRY